MRIHWAVAEDLEEHMYSVFTILGMCTQPFPNTEVGHAADTDTKFSLLLYKKSEVGFLKGKM